MKERSPAIVALILEVYQKQKSQTQRYSLRSFAKYLRIDQSALSKMINQKRSVPDRLRRKILRISKSL